MSKLNRLSLRFSQDPSLYTSDPLFRLPVPILKIIAQIIYKPEIIRPLSNWIVGSTENNLSKYRNFLRRIWEVLIIKSESPKKLTITWYHRSKLALELASEISRCIFVEGIYEPNQFFFLNKFLKKGMVFVDVGANSGTYTIFASKLVDNNGLVLAIEPSQREFKQLEENLRINKAINVKALRIAVASRNSKRKLWIAAKPYDGHNSFGPFGYESTKIDHSELVVTKTLDRLVKELRIDRMDFIKVDVEGAEFSALKGCYQTLKTLNPIILIELSDRTLGKQGFSSIQILRLLNSLSYKIYNMDQRGNLVKVIKKKYFDGENIFALPKERKLPE